MSTVFLWKKKYGRLVIGGLSVFFTAVVLVYAYFLTGVQAVGVYKTFYFLVSTSTRIQASTHHVSLGGGAGYTLSYAKREYVVYNVYLNGSDGKKACAAVTAQGENTELLSLGVEKLYLKTRAEKEQAQSVRNGMSLLYEYITLLSREIVRLDNGGTQESCKRILSELFAQLSFSEREYREAFPAVSLVYKNIVNTIEELRDGIVYSKDLRYLLCETCVAYIQLGESFAL